VVLFFGFLGLFLRFWRFNLWKGEDGTWMRRLSDVLRGREESLPEVGKYNAGQKLVFWLMSILIVVLICSGLALWDQYFAQYTSVEQKRAAVLIHALAAVVIICVWIVHVYAAIWVRGTIRAMVTGSVTGGWAWRHHRKWLRELVTGKRDNQGSGAKPAE
jgi:formate dehydrogenase subunit gamma